MKTIIFAKDPLIARALSEKFELVAIKSAIEGVSSAYGSSSVAVLLSDRPSECLSQAVSLYAPSRAYFADFALSASVDRRLGDVILPNAFFRTEDAASFGQVEITRENRDSFAKDPIFFEHYERQGDYDFSGFGFSVGGVCVSSDDEKNVDALEKIGFAYAADAGDSESYDFAKRAVSDRSVVPYVVLGLSDGHSGGGNADAEVVSGRIVAIIAFLEDSFKTVEEDFPITVK